jgi:hypothetical protein
MAWVGAENVCILALPAQLVAILIMGKLTNLSLLNFLYP